MIKVADVFQDQTRGLGRDGYCVPSTFIVMADANEVSIQVRTRKSGNNAPLTIGLSRGDAQRFVNAIAHALANS